jgi:hypothetical protein
VSFWREANIFDWSRTDWGLFGDAAGPVTLLAVVVAYRGLVAERRDQKQEDRARHRQVRAFVRRSSSPTLDSNEPFARIELLNHSGELVALNWFGVIGAGHRGELLWAWEDGASPPVHLEPGGTWAANGVFRGYNDDGTIDQSETVRAMEMH